MGLLPLRSVTPAFLLLLYAASGIPESGPAAILWTAPAILASALMIAWAAESAQFFIAQGFALAILAWMQTLPEFAVEAVIAWHRETHLLLASGKPLFLFLVLLSSLNCVKPPIQRLPA